ncbi:MAG: S41 family peptidase [Bacteroidales bacterium]|nr:S41 family peptidase [Bacteroidales bacterium]
MPVLLSGQAGDPRETIQKYNTALQIINFAYVEKVNESELVEKAIIATLKELDPHSRYIPREELRDANEPLEGSYEGIGVTYQLFNDTILIISPYPGGPSDQAGIRPGDKIIRIEDENVTGNNVDHDFVLQRLRGKKGSKVNLGIARHGKKNIMEFQITRDEIPIRSLDAGYMVNETIGYIKLNRFSMSTPGEFHMAMSQLKKNGMQSLILDLRGNSGGYLDVAVDLADMFLDAGKLIVYTEGVSSPKKKYNSTFSGSFEEGKLVVLIDEGSASASEIVSGAIQDWDRGLIIGRRSFGKGLVQRPYFLPDSSVIRLTIARYYTPSGRCIQKPYDEGYDEYSQEIENRIKHGELTWADSIPMPDSLKYFTARQRIVYGGGGIMPDVFVPWDSLKFSDYYTGLLGKGIINDFILHLLDKQRCDLEKKYSTKEQFIKKFNPDEGLFDSFMTYSAEKGVPPGDSLTEYDTLMVKYQLKAHLARNLWDNDAYIRIMNETDDAFRKAVIMIGNEAYLSLLTGN